LNFVKKTDNKIKIRVSRKQMNLIMREEKFINNFNLPYYFDINSYKVGEIDGRVIIYEG